MNNAALQSIVYVCVVSDFNLPELEACLVRQPSDIVLVVSDSYQNSANLLEEILKKISPESIIHRLDKNKTDHPLSGDDVIECQNWVKEVLVKKLESSDLRNKPHWLNFTGGTKAMTAALLTGHIWQQLDYKARSKRVLQVIAPNYNNNNSSTSFQKLSETLLKDPLPEQVASLQAKHVQSDPINRLIKEHPDASLELAKAIWNAQEAQDTALNLLLKCFERIWSEGRGDPKWNQNKITLSWDKFTGEKDHQVLIPWLEKLNQLDSESISFNESTITFPGNKKTKKTKPLYQWLNGTWLEQLAQYWLVQVGIPQTSIIANLKLSNGDQRSESEREADIYIHYHSNTFILEVKAGLPPNHQPSDLENQISSIGDRFGKTSKALFISPKLSTFLEEKNRLESFYIRCEENHVALCRSKKDLEKFISR